MFTLSVCVSQIFICPQLRVLRWPGGLWVWSPWRGGCGVGPGREILHHTLHTESSQDPGEPWPRRQAAVPAALPPGITPNPENQFKKENQLKLVSIKRLEVLDKHGGSLCLAVGITHETFLCLEASLWLIWTWTIWWKAGHTESEAQTLQVLKLKRGLFTAFFSGQPCSVDTKFGENQQNKTKGCCI